MSTEAQSDPRYASMSGSLEDMVEDGPSIEEEVRYPLYWVEDDETPKEILDSALVKIVNKIALDGIEPSDIVAIVSDYGDADGKSAASTLKYKYRGTDKHAVYVPAGHRGQCPDTVDALQRVGDVLTDATVYFTDIAPNEGQTEEIADALVHVAENNELRVRDHHPWPDEAIETVEPVADDFVVDDNQGDDQVCATEIVAREDFEDTPEMIEDLAHVVGVRDLWKEDLFDEYPAGEYLVAFSYWADYGEFTELVSRHGIEFMDEAKELVEKFNESRERKQAKIELAADRADWYEIGEYTVAAAYGGVYSSGLGQELRERGADIVAISTPAGKYSFRSRDEYPVCEDIAKALDGGGHPTAAGANPELVVGKGDYEEASEEEQEELVAYTEHWRTWGELAKEYAVDTIREVLTGDGDLTETADSNN